MTILVIGGNSSNKGAQLMLVAVAEAVGRHFGPDVKLLVSPLCGNRKWLEQTGYRLLNVPFPLMGSRFCSPLLLRLLEVASAILPCNRLSDVSAVLDISGFSFSDQFGIHPLQNLDYFTERLAAKGIVYVLLPQAFGPFERRGMASTMKRVISRAAMVCARDYQSFQYLQRIADSAKNVELIPDITVEVSAEETGFQNDGSYCCIVPNGRMLDLGKDAWGENYEQILRQVAEHIGVVHGRDLLVVVHDASGKDMEIALSLQKNTNVPMRICAMDDPLKLKGVISKSELVVGSRFHALVSALSSGVPAVAFGWSHKYAEVFGEYGQANYVFSSPKDFDVSVLDQMLDPSIRSEWLEKNRAINATKQKKVEAMWVGLKRLVNSGGAVS